MKIEKDNNDYRLLYYKLIFYANRNFTLGPNTSLSDSGMHVQITTLFNIQTVGDHPTT